MPRWKPQYEGVEELTLAVMGCVVNGPGESKAANIGISLPGTGEAPNCPVYIDGEHATTLRGTYDELAAAFQRLLDDYVERKYRTHSRRENVGYGYDHALARARDQSPRLECPRCHFAGFSSPPCWSRAGSPPGIGAQPAARFDLLIRNAHVLRR